MRFSLRAVSSAIALTGGLMCACFLIPSTARCDAMKERVGDSVAAKEAPRWVDSLVWKNKRICDYILDTLRTNDRFHNLSIGELHFAGTDKIRSESGQFPLRAPSNWRRDTLWIISPDSTMGALAGGFGEVDSDLLLCNRNNQLLIERLESCGPGCTFLSIRWIDRYRFVFPQIERYDAVVATVKIFDLVSDSVYTFKSDSLPLTWPPQNR